MAGVANNSYESSDVARVYDVKNAGRADFEFYLKLAGELADGRPDFHVLDIGCGTGVLGVDLAHAGYAVTGVDPAQGMIDVARNRPGGDAVTWIHGYAGDVPDGFADLAIMTGHVAQYFLTAESWADVLAQVHRALRPGGWRSRAATPVPELGTVGYRSTPRGDFHTPMADRSRPGSNSWK